MAQQNPDDNSNNNVDPEMLKNLELLINMDVLENEEDWDSIENLDENQDILNKERDDEA